MDTGHPFRLHCRPTRIQVPRYGIEPIIRKQLQDVNSNYS